MKTYYKEIVRGFPRKRSVQRKRRRGREDEPLRMGSDGRGKATPCAGQENELSDKCVVKNTVVRVAREVSHAGQVLVSN